MKKFLKARGKFLSGQNKICKKILEVRYFYKMENFPLHTLKTSSSSSQNLIISHCTSYYYYKKMKKYLLILKFKMTLFFREIALNLLRGEEKKISTKKFA